MKKSLALVICTSLLAGCATASSTPDALNEQTPKGAIEEAEAAQAANHSWMWWAAGGVAAAIAVGLASKHSSNDSAGASDSTSRHCGSANVGNVGEPGVPC